MANLNISLTLKDIETAKVSEMWTKIMALKNEEPDIKVSFNFEE